MRNRNIEMVEALYNMNRVGVHYATSTPLKIGYKVVL